MPSRGPPRAFPDHQEPPRQGDPSSRELLDRTIERIIGLPVLLLATFRPEFQPPWTGQPHLTVLTLPRLVSGALLSSEPRPEDVCW